MREGHERQMSDGASWSSKDIKMKVRKGREVNNKLERKKGG